LLNFR